MDDLKGVLDDLDGLQLLAVVAALAHEATDEALHNRARGLVSE